MDELTSPPFEIEVYEYIVDENKILLRALGWIKSESRTEQQAAIKETIAVVMDEDRSDFDLKSSYLISFVTEITNEMLNELDKLDGFELIKLKPSGKVDHQKIEYMRKRFDRDMIRQFGELGRSVRNITEESMRLLNSVEPKLSKFISDIRVN